MYIVQGKAFWLTHWWDNFVNTMFARNGIIRDEIDASLAEANGYIINKDWDLAFDTREDALAFILRWS